MDIKTSQQYWFQMEAKPTAELRRIWEQRKVDPQSDLNLGHIEQVLIARHELPAVAEPLQGMNPLSRPALLIDTFTIKQVSSDQTPNAWVVILKSDLAEFINPRLGERFMIDRAKGRLEFQFQHTGFLMLSENTTALVRGKQFDFGPYKPNLEIWLKPLTSEDLHKGVQFWGWVMILVGALSLLQTTLPAVALGGLLILLGIANLFARHRAIFILNGLLLWIAGLLGIIELASTRGMTLLSSPVVFGFWLALHLFQIFWGYRDFLNYRKYQA